MLGIFLLFMYKEKDGKPLLARRGKRNELLEGDEKLDDEDTDTDSADAKKAEDAEGGKPDETEQDK